MRENNNIFSNERVSASAGSGKTYSLTSRFIALSEYERNSEDLPDPTSIIALTFTKKSASEFLRKIITRLSASLENPKDFKELCYSIFKLSKRQVCREEVENLLLQSVKNIDKLKLSTIDSFFSSVLNLFVNEIGVFTPMQIMDSQTEVDSQKNIIEYILENVDFADKEFKNFIEVIKKKDGFGKEFLSLNENLQKSITNALYFKNNLAQDISFGDSSVLKNSLLAWNQKDYDNDVQEFKTLVDANGLPKPFKTLVNYLEATNDKDVALSGSLYEEISKKYANNELLGDVEIPYGTKGKFYILPDVVSKKLNLILTRIFDAHVASYFRASEQMGKFLRQYKEIYFREIISKGMLTFADVPELLNSCEKAKELLEFRLDSKFKHWLFDEFQDTSRTQWQFFSGIVDNILNPQEDGDIAKTFYYVGDIKQSIYSWRGGDKELFKEIFESNQSNVKHPIIEADPLSKSYRSHANIIKILNEIFNKSEVYSAYLKDVFTESPTDEFLDIYSEHFYNAKDSERTSVSQLRVVKELEKDDSFYEQIYDIIKEVQPSGKSIGILVNKNTEIQAICDYLKSKGVNVAPEGVKNLAQNNMLVAGFAQFLKHLIHPADTASLEYLKMTPFSEILGVEAYKQDSLRFLSKGRYADFAKSICARIELKSKANFEELLQVCKDFENSKKRGVANLIKFLENKDIALSSNSNFVQVMTVHKSKGLEFSVVILPHLEGLCSVKFNGLQLVENNGKSTILYMPVGSIINLNKALQDTKLRHKNNAMFENICKFYVALTRAENALYIVLKDTGKTPLKMSTLLSEAFFRAKTEDVIETQYVETYNIGNPKWYVGLKAKEAKRSKENFIARVENPSIVEPLPESISPSATKTLDENVDRQALAFGSAMHKVLEQIEFVDDVDSAIAEALSLVGVENTLLDNISNVLKRFFTNPEIRLLFEKRNFIEVKNEFSFTSELEGDIVTGQIDRLILEKDTSGKVIFARIIDYKGAYSPSQNAQLNLYKGAVQSIYNLAENQVAMQVLGYSTCQVTTL